MWSNKAQRKFKEAKQEQEGSVRWIKDTLPGRL